MGANEGFIRTEFGGARSCDRKFTGQKSTKKFTNLNRYISVSTDIDEKSFVIFERTLNHLFFWLRSSEMESSRTYLALRKPCGKFLKAFFVLENA